MFEGLHEIVPAAIRSQETASRNPSYRYKWMVLMCRPETEAYFLLNITVRRFLLRLMITL